MKTIRQLLRVRSLVLAIALASLLLLWPLATPASAGGGYDLFYASKLVELKLGTDASGNPAAIATLHAACYTNWPAGAPVRISLELSVDGNEQALSSWIPVNSRDAGNPDIITVIWVYPLTRGTHIVSFSGLGTVGYTGFGSMTNWQVGLTMTVP